MSVRESEPCVHSANNESTVGETECQAWGGPQSMLSFLLVFIISFDISFFNSLRVCVGI